MTHAKTANPAGRLGVGFGKQNITPALPFPLAGIADKKPRLAERVRDPLFARALAFHDGRTTAIVVSVDLLLIYADLRAAIEQRARALGAAFDGLMISATHTHSSLGGYWGLPSAKLFLGEYRQDIYDALVENIARAAAAAVADLQPAELRFGETQPQYLNYNRRHKDGAIDRNLGVLAIERPGGKPIRAVFFGAHPVAAAFRELNTASADYPGALIKRIEADGAEGIFVVGPVGGVNVLFPEGPLDMDVHLELLGRLFYEQVEKALAAATPVQGDDVAFAAAETKVNVDLVRFFPDRLAWADSLALPLRLWVRRFGRRGGVDGRLTRVPVVRVGDVVFCGFPADLGASVSLAARRLIAERGWRTAVAASQTDDYVGYVHLPAEYDLFSTADKPAMWMLVYENAMAFAGRHMGEELLAALDSALVKAAP
jgi:hypothetical protein